MLSHWSFISNQDNLFEWHFTLRGPPNTDYAGGFYHGRITLPPDYPMKPPSIILLTPNGRFETNKKICLSISGHHPESWQPSWSIRTALLAIIGFMPTHGNGAIGSLDYTPEERHQLALKSQNWRCPECGYVRKLFEKKDALSVSSEAADYKTSIPLECNILDSANQEIPLTDGATDTNERLSQSQIPLLSSSSTVENVKSSIITENFTVISRHKRHSTAGEMNSARQYESILSNQCNPQITHSYWSLVAMWIIIFAIVVLFVRRLLSE